MLSKETVSLVGDVVKYASKFRALLVEWDEAKRQLVVTRRLGQRLGFGLTATYLMGEGIYQGLTLHAETMKPTMEAKLYWKLVAHFSSRLIGLALALMNAYKAEEIAQLFNQLVVIEERFKKFAPREECRDRCYRLFWCFKVFVFTQPLIPAMTYTFESSNKRYWQGQVMPNMMKLALHPLFFLVEYWISFFVMLGAIFMGYMAVPYYFSAPACVNMLMDQTKTHTKQGLSGAKVSVLYKGLRIHNVVFNNCFADTMAFGVAACLMVQVFMLAFTVKLTPHSELPGSLIFPIGALALMAVPRYMFAPTVEVATASEEFIGVCRKTKDPYYKRIVRAFQPLSIKVSKFFSMSRSTVFEFFNEVVDKTQSLLLLT